ncbi:hypothetical protein DAERI_030312 [Deinococcus aerius]|uniref:Uncharacterized protein n=1 Tax=Deinococcus aerius TaxID=200253 RepID=A0A2I9D3I4_9DEIO|nr:hypothetical protein [Deinococcus aerius]GBF05146.1 hypothetical protein DAERI_030312 [Deinococcus aerius]
MACVRESAKKRDALLAGAQLAVREQRRRVAEVRAREHVGAAGWAQTSTLEQIIRAGREGLAATDTLRQLVRLTSEQVRALPLAAEQEREEHARALSEIVRSGETQITAAEALEELICQALEEVARTSVDEVNVRTLRQIHGWVREQMVALNTIIEAAQAQADTLEQVARLDRLNAEYQSRVDALRKLGAEEEAHALAVEGERIVERLAELDAAGPHQLGALTRIGEAVAEQVTETGTSRDEQAEALDDLAHAASEKAQELREG